MTFDPADKLFQQDLIDSLRKAMAGAMLAEADKQTWERRAEALMRVAVDIYGADAARALFDQALAGAEETASSFMDSLDAALSAAAGDPGGSPPSLKREFRTGENP